MFKFLFSAFLMPVLFSCTFNLPDGSNSDKSLILSDDGSSFTLCVNPGGSAVSNKVTNVLILLKTPSGKTEQTNWNTAGPLSFTFKNKEFGTNSLTVIEMDTAPAVFTNQTNITVRRGYDTVVTITPGGNVTVQVQLQVRFFNEYREYCTDTIYPWFSVSNTGRTSVDLSQLKLRYYYTADCNITQIYVCDHAGIGLNHYTIITGYVCGVIYPMSSVKAGADHYLEIGFSSCAGSLRTGEVLFVQSRVRNSQWLYYSQKNDYSFDACDTDYADWKKVTAYYQGTLFFGNNP
jgi:hypothetical protein